MNLDAVLQRIAELPAAATYAVLAAGSALENVFPPVPADTVVLFGAFLAGTGQANPWIVLLATWAANAAGAIGVYYAARRYGIALFRDGPGRHLLNESQLDRIALFYERWGASALFVSRFLPGVRALVPIFAGVSDLRSRYVVGPLAVASLVWYGAIVWAGSSTGENFDEVRAFTHRYDAPLAWAGGLVLLGIVIWWLRTRRAA
ncbi:MAG TPA: DedA family protein [Longimicrobiales bacterium]|nr:DedA family protein [Longimicrobiales bacterium]